MSGKMGMKAYPYEIKEQAVRLHLETGLTIKEVNHRLAIADPDRVKKWCATYRKDGFAGLQPKPRGQYRKKESIAKEPLEDEIKRLRMENELLRNFLYEAERGC